MHNDIRRANIMAKTVSPGVHRLFFIDYGFSREIGSKEDYQGTVETARQRILEIIYELGDNAMLEVTIRDDLESFYKFVSAYRRRMDLYWDSYLDLYEKWAEDFFIMMTRDKYADDIEFYKTSILTYLELLDRDLSKERIPYDPNWTSHLEQSKDDDDKGKTKVAKRVCF